MKHATRSTGRWWLAPLVALLLGLPMLAGLPAPAAAESLTAKITKVDGTTVVVGLAGKTRPAVGDKASIGFEVAGVGLIPLKGTWRVKSVSGSTATLAPEGNADQPRVGQVATIEATQQVARGNGGGTVSPPGNGSKPGYFLGKRIGEPLDPPAGSKQAPEVFKDDIRYIQQRLGQLGYDPGPADGVMGRRTRNAIRAFQRDRDMQVDGRATPILLLAVKASDGPVKPPKVDRRSNQEILTEAQDYYFGRNGRTKDYARSFRLNQILAKRGDAEGLYNVGVVYAFGNGAKKNYVTARGYFEQAAKRNHPRALYNLSVLYEKGLGTKKDARKAMEYMLRAAAAGLPEAYHGVGVYYENGIGVAKDMNTAVSWYRQGAAKGCDKAKRRLAKLNGQTGKK